MSRQQEESTEQASGNYSQEGPGASATCVGDTEFPRRYPVDAAFADLQTWVTTGVAAPSAPPFSFTGLNAVTESIPPLPTPSSLFPTGTDVAALGLSPLELVRDPFGNAVGGLRLPVVTTPVASYNGNLCVLLGISVPLLPTQLASLYPTHGDYVTKMVADTQAAVATRYLTVSDGIDLLQRACSSAIPLWGTTPADRTARGLQRPLRAPPARCLAVTTACDSPVARNSADVHAGDGAGDHQALDLAGAFEDRVDLRVAVPPLHRVLAHVAVPAEDLDRLLGDA